MIQALHCFQVPTAISYNTGTMLWFLTDFTDFPNNMLLHVNRSILSILNNVMANKFILYTENLIF